MPNDLMKLVESVLAEKRALDQKERQLIDSLNRVLPGMGYHVVPTSDGRGAPVSRRGRPRRITASASKTLVCEQCGRRFAHPLHLGRHTAAMHRGTGVKVKAVRRRTRTSRRKRSGKAARGKTS
jgi:hypothetical protein